MFIKKYQVILCALTLFGSVSAFAKLHDSVQASMRTLWHSHMEWERAWLVADSQELNDKQVTEDRLIHTAEDIGAFFKPYFGEAASNKLGLLMDQKVRMQKKLIQCMIDLDAPCIEEYSKKLQYSVNNIAVALDKMNPKKWDLAELKDQFNEHIKNIQTEADAYVKKDWNKAIQYHDDGVEQAMELSDYLAHGLK